MPLPGIISAPAWRRPSIPVITGVSPDDGHSSPVTVSGTADAGADITLYRDAEYVGWVTANQSTGAWSISPVYLNLGDNNLTAIASFGSHDSALSSPFNARYVASGSQSFSTPGSYQFEVPVYNSLTVNVRGGSGGGGGYYFTSGNSTAGGAGTQSSFNNNVIAYPGTGGSHAHWSDPGYQGSPGGASGGDENYEGGGFAGGLGGNTPFNDGGPSGRSVKTYSAGQLTIGAQISVAVGSAGNGGYGSDTTGAPGHVGQVSISWS